MLFRSVVFDLTSVSSRMSELWFTFYLQVCLTQPVFSPSNYRYYARPGTEVQQQLSARLPWEMPDDSMLDLLILILTW